MSFDLLKPISEFVGGTSWTEILLPFDPKTYIFADKRNVISIGV